MKLAHLADTHLGLRQMHHTNGRGRNVREQDIYDAFERAIDRIIDLRPDAVVHAGDLFDGYHPSSTAMAVAFDQFKRLHDEQIPAIVIAGNHSTPRVAATDHAFGLLNRLGCVQAVHAQPTRIEVGDLAITAIPHCNDSDQLREWIAAAKPSPDHRYNILVAHLGLDGLSHVGSSEAGHITLSGEILEAVSEFSYIALGHLHKFYRPRVNAVYAGSLERITWADDARIKGIVEVDLTCNPLEDSYVTLHPIESRRFLQLPDLDASQTDNLTAAIVDAGERSDVDGAVVKLPVRNVTIEAYGAVDRRSVAAAFDECLHLELDPHFVDATSAAAGSAAPQELREFLAARVPRGIEADAFIARAERYMTRASEEIGA